MSSNVTVNLSYMTYGDRTTSLPLDEFRDVDGSQCVSGRQSSSMDSFTDCGTRRSSLTDGYIGYDVGCADQTPFTETSRFKLYDECFVDAETVDTSGDTTYIPDTEFPTDGFELYGYQGGTVPSGFLHGTPDQTLDDGNADQGRPVIRLKSTADSHVRVDNVAPHGSYTSIGKQVVHPTNYHEPTPSLDEYMRSSSQLYQPVDRGYRDDSSCGTAYVSNNSTLATPSLNLALDNASARSLNISPIVPIAHHVEAYSEDSDTFLTPRMSGASGYYKRFCPPSNYCVYVGSETNRSNCGCNLSRPLGGNCHLSGCPVITSDMEPSTESFPVSGSSQLQNLVRRLHTVVDRLKNGSSPKDERVPCLPIQQPLYWHTDVRSVALNNGYNPVNTVPSASYETIAGASFEYSKRHCSVLPDYNTNREMHPAPEYYVQTSYEDSPYDNSLTAEIDNSLMQRKNVVASKSDIGREVEVQSRNELGRFVPTLTASPISSHECRTQYTTPKASKKKNAAGSTLTGEKVSGVWYDANRHLWRVVYMKGNKRKTQGFSSIKLGYEEARRKAIELRHEMMALRRSDKV